MKKKIINLILLLGISVTIFSSITWYGQENSIYKLKQAENQSTYTINNSSILSDNTLKELELRNDILRVQIKKRKEQKKTVPFIYAGIGLILFSIGLRILSPSVKNT